MDFWVLRDDRSIEGPVSRAEIAMRIRRGALGRDRMVCAVGGEAWEPAGARGDLAGLFEEAAGAAAGPSVAAPAAAAGAGTFRPGVGGPGGMDTPHGRVVFHSMEEGILGPADGLTFGGAFGDGWRLFRSAWLPLVGATLLLVLASVAAQLPMFAALPFADPYGTIPPGIGLAAIGGVFLLQFLLVVPLFAGTVVWGARRLRGEDVGFATVKQAWGRLGSLFGVTLGMILVGIVAGAAAMAVMVGGGFVAATLGGPLVAMGLMLIVFVLMTIVGLRMMPALPYAIDPRFAEADGSAIGSAWQATGGHGLRLFGLYLTVSILVGLCGMAFVLPALLFGTPLALAVAAAVYYRLF